MALISKKIPEGGGPMRALFRVEGPTEVKIYKQLLNCEGGTRCPACGEIIDPRPEHCLVEVVNPLNPTPIARVVGAFKTVCNHCHRGVEPEVANFVDCTCFPSILDIVERAIELQRRQREAARARRAATPMPDGGVTAPLGEPPVRR